MGEFETVRSITLSNTSMGARHWDHIVNGESCDGHVMCGHVHHGVEFCARVISDVTRSSLFPAISLGVYVISVGKSSTLPL